MKNGRRMVEKGSSFVRRCREVGSHAEGSGGGRVCAGSGIPCRRRRVNRFGGCGRNKGAALGTLVAWSMGAKVKITVLANARRMAASKSAHGPAHGCCAQDCQNQPAGQYRHADKRCRVVNGIVGIVPEVKLKTREIQQSMFRRARFVTARRSPALHWVVDAGTPSLADPLPALLRAAWRNPTVVDKKYSKASVATIKGDGVLHVPRRRDAEALGSDVDHTTEREYESRKECNPKEHAESCCKSQPSVAPYKSSQHQQKNKNQADPNPRKLNPSVGCQNHKTNLTF